MKLSQLEPEFLRIVDERVNRHVDTLAEADGVLFKCPLCFARAGYSGVGVHSVLCWAPHVDQTHSPVPGRWAMLGTGLHDLSLVAGSSSVFLTGPGCGAHFHILNGNVTPCGGMDPMWS